jgi:uncharacterized membrane protein
MLDFILRQSGQKNLQKELSVLSKGIDKPVKSILKSISWRIVGTLDTIIISYFITGKILIAFSIGSVEVLSKTILYYFHERLWAHIHWIKFYKKPNGTEIGCSRTEQTAERKINRGIFKNSSITVS